MLSAVVDTSCLELPTSLLTQSLDRNLKKHNNNAPSEGLLLWKAEYGRYNARSLNNDNEYNKAYNVGLNPSISTQM